MLQALISYLFLIRGLKGTVVYRALLFAFEITLTVPLIFCNYYMSKPQLNFGKISWDQI